MKKIVVLLVAILSFGQVSAQNLYGLFLQDVNSSLAFGIQAGSMGAFQKHPRLSFGANALVWGCYLDFFLLAWSKQE